MMILAEIDYPCNRSMGQRWEALARDIAEKVTTEPAAADPSPTPGELLILGSGIALVDLTADAEAEILAADHVFYCLCDRVTQVWISRLRPDALDLHALYSDKIDRYFTYVRMAEAMLHHVRRGEKVVGIFYGHPGIFATPAHRAIQIARREGHRAQMRPGISALDYLVAEVGFDPAIPGLLSYEATDMLLRRRRIDPSLHVVIWQVGVVGEFGFNPAGFQNRGYDLLIDTLEQVYGKTWIITNYIASRFVGVEPVVDRYSIEELRSEQARKRISALSTFYIEPARAVATDAQRSITLGLRTAEQPLHPPQLSFDVASYTNQDVDSLRRFGSFEMPTHYSVPPPTPGIDFMLALSRELELQSRYREDPAATLEDSRFAALSERARKLLAIPNTIAIEAGIAEPAGSVEAAA